MSEGKTIIEAARPLGVREQTYYRWRKEYGGMEVAQAHRLKELEQENCYVESFNGKIRDELLDGEIFTTLQEAKVLTEV